MAIIKKSLLFTVHIVDNKITCVRCNLTGKFVKKSVYVEIVNSEKLDYGVFTESKTIEREYGATLPKDLVNYFKIKYDNKDN